MSIPKRKKRHNFRVKVSNDFPWRVLGKVLEDLKTDFANYGVEDVWAQARAIVRNRDVKTYIACCKGPWSLKKLNILYREPEAHNLQRIRLIRILTIFQKFNFPDSPFDQLGTAIMNFKKYEAQCTKTNNNNLFVSLLNDDEDSNLSSYDSTVLYPIVQHARHFIARTLGNTADLSILLWNLRHGPGATADKRGRLSIPVEKYIPPIGHTTNALELVRNVFTSDDRWMRSVYEAGITSPLFEITDEAPVLFVPKDAEKYRGIMPEATGNVYLQLAIDAYIKQRLRLCWGIDLRYQSKNQDLARLCSLTGDGVTVDLSGASDTVALVWLLFLPDKWAELLFSLRTPVGVLPTGEKVELQKLSSMGNGFTFSIETLIFASLLYGVIRNEGFEWKDFQDSVAVYGDDIVLPTQFYSHYAIALKKLGFSLNRDKSFSSGPIRESCGEDFYNGYSIKRFTVSDLPQTVPDLYIMHNQLRALEQRFGVDLTFTRLEVLRIIPKDLMNYGPVTEEWDSHIHTSSSCVLKTRYKKNFHRVYYVYKKVTREPISAFKVTSKHLGVGFDGAKRIVYTFTPKNTRAFSYAPWMPLLYLNRPFEPKVRPVFWELHPQLAIAATEKCGEKSTPLKGLYRLQTSKVELPVW